MEPRKLGTITVFGVKMRVFETRYLANPERTAVYGVDKDGEETKFSVNTDDAPRPPGEFVLHHDWNFVRDELLRTGAKVWTDTGLRVNYGLVRGQPVLRLNRKEA